MSTILTPLFPFPFDPSAPLLSSCLGLWCSSLMDAGSSRLFAGVPFWFSPNRTFPLSPLSRFFSATPSLPLFFHPFFTRNLACYRPFKIYPELCSLIRELFPGGSRWYTTLAFSALFFEFLPSVKGPVFLSLLFSSAGHPDFRSLDPSFPKP